jgi:hypothetical protein
MANTQSMCTSFLGELLSASHNFSSANPAQTASTANTFKAALYVTTATINATTTAYSATNEVSGTNYTAGGITVTNANNPSSTNSSVTAGVGYWTPSGNLIYGTSLLPVTLATAFDTVLIYNNTLSGKNAVSVHTFGSQTITAGIFTLTMPSNTTTNALLRLSTT